jgi:hypothetical protein
VTACVIAPLVAVTVNTEVVSLEPGPETPEGEPPHPASEAEAAKANIMSQRVRVSLSRRRGIQQKKHARAAVEVTKGVAQVLAAEAATRVTVNLAEPLPEIVAGEKLQVAIVDEPEHDSETFWVKPSSGLTEIVVVADCPSLNDKVVGAAINVKSGGGRLITYEAEAIGLTA